MPAQAQPSNDFSSLCRSHDHSRPAHTSTDENTLWMQWVFFFFHLPLAALHANWQMKYSHFAAKHTSMAFCCKRNFQEWPLRDDIIAIMIHSCDLTAPVALHCWSGIANQLSLCLQYLIFAGALILSTNFLDTSSSRLVLLERRCQRDTSPSADGMSHDEVSDQVPR